MNLYANDHVQQLKEEHKQRMAEVVDSHATVLAGFHEKISGNTDIGSITNELSKLQNMMASQMNGKKQGKV